MWKIVAFRNPNGQCARKRSHHDDEIVCPRTPVVERSNESGLTVYYTPYPELSSPSFESYISSPLATPTRSSITRQDLSPTQCEQGPQRERVTLTLEKVNGSPHRYAIVAYTPGIAQQAAITPSHQSPNPPCQRRNFSTRKIKSLIARLQKKAVFRKTASAITKVVPSNNPAKEAMTALQHKFHALKTIFMTKKERKAVAIEAFERTPPRYISFNQHVLVHSPGLSTAIEALKREDASPYATPACPSSRSSSNKRSIETRSAARSLNFDDDSKTNTCPREIFYSPLPATPINKADDEEETFYTPCGKSVCDSPERALPAPTAATKTIHCHCLPSVVPALRKMRAAVIDRKTNAGAFFKTVLLIKKKSGAISSDKMAEISSTICSIFKRKERKSAESVQLKWKKVKRGLIKMMTKLID